MQELLMLGLILFLILNFISLIKILSNLDKILVIYNSIKNKDNRYFIFEEDSNK